MAICRYCGTQIPDSAKFCTECGAAMDSTSMFPDPVPQAPQEPANIPAEPFQESVEPAESYYQMPDTRPWDPEQSGKHSESSRLIGIALIVVLLAAALFLQFGGHSRYGGKDVSISAIPSLLASDPVEVGSTWHGTLTVSGHAGGNYTEEGTYEIWAILDSMEEGGDVFFEIYEDEDMDPESEPLLSMWAEVRGSSVVPVIGEEDAWFLDLWLTPEDQEAMTFVLENGSLVNDYEYDDGYESFHSRIELEKQD